MIQNRFFATLGLLVALFTTQSASAFFSVMDTGDILDKGQYRAIFEPQFVFTKSTGANIGARLDSYLTDSTNVRGVICFGSSIDFYTGAFLKWSPIPDVDKQPAIAGEFGIVYARYGGEPEVSLRFSPIVSKKFETSAGYFTPYGSIPLALETRKGKAIGTAHIAGGTQYQTLNWRHVQFMGELGLDLKDSYSYITLGVLMYFDEEKGFSRD